MKLEFNPFFEEALFGILMYIMLDSEQASLTFEEELFEHLKGLLLFPYKFRKSLYYDDEQIRDYIFMGYTIPYLIDEENDLIVVLDIFKWVEK
ncbi:MAG: type II toxin-antitoxin system RelE/ParE family toxin [Sulfurovum sp.]|nr:MAG: type II toxin-antitoxin system RelE/ParE family toxin [Sulfurovum sp.]